MRFISKRYSGLKITLDPAGVTVIGGRPIIQGLNGMFPAGKRVEFNEGIYDTTNEKEIEALKNHPEYGFAFFSDEPGAVEVSAEAKRADAEKKAKADEVASQCPHCGKKFKNEQAVNGHMSNCPKKPAQ